MWPAPAASRRSASRRYFFPSFCGPPMKRNNEVFIFQIFYDQKSQQVLDPGFIPLDNTSNERPDWFEFWVIRNFLNKHPLEENAWYGFLSPRFRTKTGLESKQVISFVDTYAIHSDVALFSPGWDQIAYFQNPFEQGEMWHPGLSDLSQSFLDAAGMSMDLPSLVTDSTTTVFCNYMVAKANFWKQWLNLANRFFEMAEADKNAMSGQLIRPTSYGSKLNLAPMKTFLQERFATVLLAKGGFKTVALDQSSYAPIFTRLFNDDFRTRRLLQACDLLKQQYNLTRDNDYFSMYQKLRKQITFKPFT